MLFRIDYNWTLRQLFRHIAVLASIPAAFTFIMVGLAELAPSRVSIERVEGMLSAFQGDELTPFVGLVSFLCIVLSLLSGPHSKWFRFCEILCIGASELFLSLGSAYLGIGFGLLVLGVLTSTPNLGGFVVTMSFLVIVILLHFISSKVVFNQERTLHLKWLRIERATLTFQVIAVPMSLFFIWLLWTQIRVV